MIFYKENGTPVYVDTNNSNIIKNGNSGCSGIVYGKNSDMCSKVYYNDTKRKHRLKKNVYSELDIINSEYLVTIYELLYNKFDSFVAAYQMEYIKRIIENILLLPTEYTLESVYGIEQLFNQLSNVFIKVDDIAIKNLIVSKDKIVLIDPDCYDFYQPSEAELIFNSKDIITKKVNKNNNIELIKLIKDLYLKYLSEYKKRKKLVNPYEKTEQLFEISPDYSIAYQLKKQIGNCKYPIDYYKKR